MNDQEKTREQLLAELHDVRRRVGGLEAQLAQTRQAEASLRASEAKYRRLYQSLMDAFVSVDMNGRIQEFNEAYRQMLGYEPEELLARTFVDITPERWHAFQAKIIQEQVLQRGYSDTYEKEYRRKDGTTFPVELRTYLIRDEHCRPAAMWAIMRDITERKRAEAELRNAKQQLEQRVQERTAELTGANERLQAEVGQRRQAEKKVAIFHRFVEAATQGFGMAHVDGQIIYVNPFLARLFGARRPEDVIGNHVSAYYPSDYLLRREKEIIPALRRNEPWQGEQRMVFPDGQMHPTIHTVFPVLDENGDLFCTAAVITDITELRDAEGAWRQSYEELRTIDECMVDGLLIADIETKEFLQANRAIGQMLGYTPEELLSMSVLDIHPQGDLSAVLGAFQAQAEGRFVRADRLPVCRKDGSVFYADVTANRIVYAGRSCLIGFFRDITDRRKAEEATRQSEAKYKALVESCPDAVAMTDLQGRIVFASERAVEQHGVRHPGELLGSQATDWVIEGDRGRFEANLRCLIAEGVRRNDQYTGIRGDGTTFDAEISSAVMRDAAGKPEALMGVYRDITERKRAEKRLRAKDMELLAAAEIQAHLLPQASPQVPGFEIAGRCYPAEVAAGDHFDYLWLPDGSLLVVLGDVSGHGIGPALVATDFCARLRTLSESQCELPEMALKVNSGLYRETVGAVFVTALLGRLDPKSRSLTYLNAGHPAALVLDSAGEVKARLASSGPPFAILPQVAFAASDPVELSDGDLVFFYTDGLVEVHCPGKPLFGIDRVLQIVQANRDRTAAEIIESLYAAVCQYAQPGKPHDDITAVVVKVLASASETPPAARQLDRCETSPPARADSDTSRSMLETEYFSVEQGDGVTIVRLVDMKHFDAENYAQLQQHLVGLVERQQPPKLLVDLGNVGYCATALINVLLMTQKSVQARSGVMKLCALREVLLETLQCLKLDGTVFSVHADETGARKAFC